MQVPMNDVIDQINTAYHALTTARNQVLGEIYVQGGNGHNASELNAIRTQMDDAVALIQRSRDHLAVFVQVSERLRIQMALNTYTGASEDVVTTRSNHHADDDQGSVEYPMVRLDELLNSLQPPLSSDDDDEFVDMDDGRSDDISDDTVDYLRNIRSWSNAYESYRDDDDDDMYEDIDDCIVGNARVKPHVILGDERASVAFDTSDMAWATQTLSETAYRMLFGLPLPPDGDWHYDIFGNVQLGKYIAPGDGDYNIPGQ